MFLSQTIRSWRAPVSLTVASVAAQQMRILSSYYATSSGPKKVAVVLSGCGVYDGSEIHETVSVLIHLAKHGAKYECFAPDRPQAHVVNHLKGQPTVGESRNILVESARIARGHIRPLSELSASAFDIVVFPGGYGAAKNLCDFAFKGPGYEVEADVKSVLRDFESNKKVIALCCISPMLAAKALPGCKVTIGNDGGVAEIIEKVGSHHQQATITQAVVDEKKKIVTTPAYMYGNANPHEVFEGIGAMIEKALKL